MVVREETLGFLPKGGGSSAIVETNSTASLAELVEQGTVLDDVKTELLDQGTTLDSLETELTAQGVSLDSILSELQANVRNNPLLAQVSHSTGAGDFTAAYTSNVTLTISSAPFTVSDSNCEVAYIVVKPSASDPFILMNGNNDVYMTSAANVITIAGAGTPLASGDNYFVGLVASPKAYDSVNSCYKSSEINPESLKNVYETNILSSTNDAAATYYLEVDLEHVGSFALHFEHSGGCTMTLWATASPDATDSATTDWIDVTNDLTGSPSIADDSGIIFMDKKRVKRLLVKYVLSDSSNARDLWINTSNL